MNPDIEINALNNVYESIKVLSNAQVKRILDWVTGKFDLDNQPNLKAVEKPVTVRGNDPLLLISLYLDEVDIYRYTDRISPISDSPGTLPSFVSIIRFGEYNE